MRRFIVSIIALLFSTYCLVPSIALAANVGFVPSTGLWFSQTSFVPGQTISVYTVVINTDYFALDGAVTFYDNNTPFSTVAVTTLPKEQVRQIKVSWTPTEGDHALSARFTQAAAVDEKGSRQNVDVGAINAVAGTPLSIGTGVIEPVTTPVIFTSSTSTDSIPSVALMGQTNVVVQKQGKNLVITPSTKPAASSGGALTSFTTLWGGAQNVVTTSQDLFAKNKEMLAKAEHVAGTITSTVGAISSAIDTGRQYVQTGQNQLEKVGSFLGFLSPVWNKVKSWWLTLTHNNEPVRVIIAVVIILLIVWMIKRAVRPKYERDYGRYKR